MALNKRRPNLHRTDSPGDTEGDSPISDVTTAPKGRGGGKGPPCGVCRLPGQPQMESRVVGKEITSLFPLAST